MLCCSGLFHVVDALLTIACGDRDKERERDRERQRVIKGIHVLAWRIITTEYRVLLILGRQVAEEV